MSFELRALLVSWASWKFYLAKEARVVWESDVSSEGRTLLFYSSRASRTAHGSWHSPSWCTVTSVPRLLACQLCHLSGRTKSKVWMILPLFTPGSCFLSSPLPTAAPLSSTGWFPHLRLFENWIVQGWVSHYWMSALVKGRLWTTSALFPLKGDRDDIAVPCVTMQVWPIVP